MRRWRHLILAFTLCLALVPSASGQAAPAEGPLAGASRAPDRPAVSATQIIVRPQTGAWMPGLEARLGRDGAKVIERSVDGKSMLVEVPAGRGSKEYAGAIAADLPMKVAEPLGYVYASEVPTDPDYDQQWGLPAIGAPTAWDYTWGSATVVIAVVDSGVDLDQPDLVDQLAPGGWDFVGDDAVADDVLGHGTHVAGIAAAEANNGVLGSGTAPDCRILPIRVLGADGSGSNWDVAQGITWATDQGADVINLSLGGETQSDEVGTAVAYALSHDVVVVAASGNSNPYRLSDVQYPAREPGVIAVGAIQNTSPYTIASFSQDGANLDIAAPGVSIFSTVIGTGGEGDWSGTSMATPFVAGTAALMKSANPGLTQGGIAAALTATATDLGVAGRDNTYGYGLVQADAAVESVYGMPVTTLTVAGGVTGANGWYTTAPTITLDADHPTDTTWYSWDSGTPQEYTVPFDAIEGDHTLSFYSVDTGGHTEVVQYQDFKVDSVDPAVPTGLTATPASTKSIALAWPAVTEDADGGTDSSGVARYRIYKNGAYLTQTTGLSYSATGLTAGTTYAFTVSAVDNAGNESGASAPALATTASNVPNITTTSMPGGQAGTAYSAALATTGATPITWSVSAGSLPGGLTLSAATGTISGTPAAAGTFAFTVKVTNTAGSDTRAFSITIAPAPVTLDPVYRFFNFTNNTHFFTSSPTERDMVIATWPDVFRYEGEAYFTNPASNTQPLYRFYNRVSASHFYTASLDEANMILSTWPDVFTLDGQTYAVNPAPVANSIPVYRFYNLRNGSHFYTASPEERDSVIAQWSATYRYEGPAFWLGQ